MVELLSLENFGKALTAFFNPLNFSPDFPPDLDLCPLLPRQEYVPWPEAFPLPTRFLEALDFSLGEILFNARVIFFLFYRQQKLIYLELSLLLLHC